MAARLSGKYLSKFPANVFGSGPISVTKAGLSYTIGFDLSGFTGLVATDISDSSATGRTVLTGTAAAGLAALGGIDSAALALKAPLASPALTGTPTAPTAGAATNTTQLSTTAFVQQEITAKAPLASPTFTGVPAAPTAAPGTNTTQIATTAFVAAAGGQPIATAAQYWANTADKTLDTDGVWAAAVPVALGNGTTIALDLNTGINFKVTLIQNATLSTPTNGKPGQTGTIEVTQGVASYTFDVTTNTKKPSGFTYTPSTAAGAIDHLSYKVNVAGQCCILGAVKAVA